MAIGKAVIPAAGLGTRMRPLTDALPKELLPLGQKTALQHILDEISGAGLVSAQIISSPNKKILNDAIERLSLAAGGPRLSIKMQDPPRGLGDAVLQAEHFSEGEPFAVALGDSLLLPDRAPETLRRLVETYENERADAAILFSEVPENEVGLYGIADPDSDREIFKLRGIIEKPDCGAAPSRLAVVGRYVLSPAVFSFLRAVKPDKKGEIQLTSAFEAMIRDGKKIVGLRMARSDKRSDIGSMRGYCAAFVDFALCDPALKGEFKTHIKGVTRD